MAFLVTSRTEGNLELGDQIIFAATEFLREDPVNEIGKVGNLFPTAVANGFIVLPRDSVEFRRSGAWTRKLEEIEGLSGKWQKGREPLCLHANQLFKARRLIEALRSKSRQLRPAELSKVHSSAEDFLVHLEVIRAFFGSLPPDKRSGAALGQWCPSLT